MFSSTDNSAHDSDEVDNVYKEEFYSGQWLDDTREFELAAGWLGVSTYSWEEGMVPEYGEEEVSNIRLSNQEGRSFYEEHYLESFAEENDLEEFAKLPGDLLNIRIDNTETEKETLKALRLMLRKTQ